MNIVEIIQGVVAWCKDHWVEILAAIGAIDVLLGVVTKLTPWKGDDSVYAFLHGWIAKLLKKPT